MPRRPAFLRLIDIERATTEIATAIRGLDFRTYRASRAVRSRIERELEIISEASRHVEASVKERHPGIPWKRVADFANWTRHSYDDVDDEMVWDIVVNQVRDMARVIHAERSRPDFPPYPAFEDFVPGEIDTFGAYEVTKDEIIAFASQFDPQPFHLDEEAGKASMLGGLAASGWHSCSIMMRMMFDGFMNGSTSLGSPGIDEVKWLKPVFPGDVLSVRREVLEARPSASKPDRGIVRFRFELMNQKGEVVMEQTNPILFGRRHPGAV